jgi:hypothetical protein
MLDDSDFQAIENLGQTLKNKNNQKEIEKRPVSQRKTAVLQQPSV